MKRGILFILLLAALPLWGEYLLEWQVTQDYYDKGLPFFDLNEDGYPELCKYWGNTVTFFDGTQDWATIWGLEAQGFDELVLWDLYKLNGQTKALCFANMIYEESNTTVQVYDRYATTPLWQTRSLNGYYSYAAITDLDGQSGDEILFGLNEYHSNTDSYTSKFYILDAATGASRYVSEVFDGYMAGPYTGDYDGDGLKEIMVNIYKADQSSMLYSFGYQSSSAIKKIVPEAIKLASAYPNPFNGRTILPVKLSESATLEITVVNMNGEIVNSLVKGEFSPGSYQFEWDGRDLKGNILSSGVYFFDVKQNKNHYRKPVSLIK
jgi:hypothetical protein